MRIGHGSVSLTLVLQDQDQRRICIQIGVTRVPYQGSFLFMFYVFPVAHNYHFSYYLLRKRYTKRLHQCDWTDTVQYTSSLNVIDQ